jgi:putative phage-type endonuclease
VTVVNLDTRRRDKIGGSEAAAACGVDPYRSRVMLWAEKTGRIERPETEAMKWGKLLEPVVFQELERQGFDVMPAPDVEWSHDSERWMSGHVDGFVDLDGRRGVLEIKTGSVFAGHDWKSDAGAPLPYLVQIHHYMALTGCEVGLLACLVGGQRLELRTVERDDAALEAILELEQEFLRYVKTDTPPPPDGSDSAKDAIRALHPESSGKTIRLDKATWEACKELRARKEQLDAVKRQAAELQQVVELAMGDAEQAVSPFDTPAARWSNVVSRRFDTTRFKQDHPALYDEYAVAKTTRRFTVE